MGVYLEGWLLFVEYLQCQPSFLGQNPRVATLELGIWRGLGWYGKGRGI